MSNKDTTYMAVNKILRGRFLSSFHSVNPTRQIEGPRDITPSSTLTDMKYNQQPISSGYSGNLVVNGDFSSGVTNTPYVIPPGWQLIGGDGNNLIADPPYPVPPLPATRAFQLGNIYNKSYLRQVIPTTAGLSYILSYYLFDSGNLTGAPWDATASLIYFSASVSNDNSPIGNVISYTYPAVDNGFGWRLFTYNFTATSNSTILTFTSSQPPLHFYLTGVSITSI
jgi:hypothetical protein